jgi:Vitamin K-dependent gamma-carboxylase
MTEPDLSQRPLSAADRWRTFWFAPEPIYTLGLVRIALGAVVVMWTLAWLPELRSMFGAQSVQPQHTHWDYQWGVFDISSSDTAVLIGWVVLLLAAIALTAGWHSRLAAVVVFVMIQSFMQLDRWVMNGGDALISVEAMFLALASCGAALSLDQRRRTGSFWSAQTRAPWVLRLLQVQMSLIYLVNVQAKLSGDPWLNGSAASYAWRAWPLFETPHWLASNALLTNAASWGTILIELALAVLVWNRRLRPWVLAAGVALHLAIMITMSIGFHSLAIFVLYLAFVPWQTVQRLPDKLRRKRRQEEPVAPVPDAVEPARES